jgi:membrane-associated phospholipid phosphatase
VTKTLRCSIPALLALCAMYSATGTANGPLLASTDVLTAVIPVTGLAVAFFTDDIEGEKEWWRNTLVNQALVTSLRVAFNHTELGERPNGGQYSFPSGHEAFVMSGAAFLGQRYGWKWGVPAYMGAVYVGVVRVHEGKHHWRDVIASGVLSYGVAWLTVTPDHANTLAPIIGPDFIGIRWERSF